MIENKMDKSTLPRKMGRRPRSSNDEQRKLTDLIDKCWSYLDNNFHKFDKKTKTHIALEIVKKAIPQKVEHELPDELVQAVKNSDINRLRGLLCQLN